MNIRLLLKRNLLLEVVDRYYVWMMVIIALLVIHLNFYAKGMQGLIPDYLDFKRIILAGFNPEAGLYGKPTFPMWGYGWLFLITENKLLILIVQNLLAIFSISVFIKYITDNGIIMKKAILLLKVLLLVSIPWYAFHSLMWPHSFAVSLFTLSFVALFDSFFKTKQITPRLILSGLLFGLALNFRSDYYLMPVGLIAICIIASQFSLVSFKKALLWLFSIYLCLVPWAFYSKHVTGHYLLTSTNSGHVFFIGLGNLPDNKWGITPYDSDPLMHHLIKKHFGTEKSSLLYDTNKFLISEFLKRITTDPLEYLRKCFYSFRSMLIGGVYAGEFFESPNCDPDCLYKTKNFSLIKIFPAIISNIFRLSYPSIDLSLVITGISNLLGKLIVLLSFLLIPLTLLVAINQNNIFLLLLLASIAYQVAINVFAYDLPSYTTNIFFLLLVNLSYGLLLIQERCSLILQRFRSPRKISS